MKLKLPRLVASTVTVAAAAAVGSAVTFPAINGWYADLEKPFFNPPNWIFGPVWTLLYALMAISLYLIWTANTRQPRRLAYWLFGVQLVLNVGWSVSFFGLQLPWLAVGVILALWIVIGLTISVFWPIRRLAAYLLLPYFAWVAFASMLNISIAILNQSTSVMSYADCTKAPGSSLQMSYPEVCVTSDGRRITNPGATVDLPALTTLSIQEFGAIVPLSGTIADAYYRYDKGMQEIYITTPRLEERLKTVQGCSAGLRGVYAVRAGSGLRESEKIEILCMPADTEATKEIKSLQQQLRAAVNAATLE